MQRDELRAAGRAWLPGVVVALAAGGAAVAGSYAAAGFTPAYVVAPVDGFIARYIPGVFITVAILVLGDLGAKLSLLSATVLSMVLLGTLAGLGRAIAREAGVQSLAGPLAGIPVWGAAAALTGRPVLALGAGVGALFVVSIASLAGRVGTDDGAAADRRRVVSGVASLVGLGAAGWLLGGRVGSTGSSGAPAAGDGERSDAAMRALAEAEDRSFDIEGLEPLVSERFYVVDTSAVHPRTAPEDWSLSVTGAVDSETSFDFDDITSRGAVREFSTLRCVGERLNGKKTDTALWTGVRVGDLLAAADVPDRCCVMARGEDGFYEEFPVDALRGALLVYRMNGRPLPRDHGAPARLVVPGHWGEIHVKWVTELEILDEPAKGYWEEKGWHGTGPVNTIAKLYVTEDMDDGRKRLAGHAYAGTRGISAVEVSTDGGDTWSEAELSEPLPGRAVWRQWRYAYEPPGGSHEVVVRATDGEGTLQPEADSGPYPSGASGWVSEEVS